MTRTEHNGSEKKAYPGHRKWRCFTALCSGKYICQLIYTLFGLWREGRGAQGGGRSDHTWLALLRRTSYQVPKQYNSHHRRNWPLDGGPYKGGVVFLPTIAMFLEDRYPRKCTGNHKKTAAQPPSVHIPRFTVDREVHTGPKVRIASSSKHIRVQGSTLRLRAQERHQEAK